MYQHDFIRGCLLVARRVADAALRDGHIVQLMSDALIDARFRNEATEQVLADRYGFTADELKRFGNRAKDLATERYTGIHAVPPALTARTATVPA